MNKQSIRISSTALLTGLSVGVLAISALEATAQSPALQEKVAQIKQAAAANKAALAHYTWQEQQQISLKGDVKSTKLYQVVITNGQQQKSEISGTPQAAPSGGRLKRHIVEKKTDEFTEYGQQIAALAKQYAAPNPTAMDQAKAQGNISLQPDAGNGTVTLVIKSYIKPGDSVTLAFNTQEKALVSVNVNTYLTDPKDAVTIAITYAKLPSGVNHVATMQINGVSKQMGVNIQNSNYQQL
jgi:hypothetical protein